MRIRWLSLLPVCVLCGCQTVVDVNVPDGYRSKIVVEGEFTPDSLWAVRVGKSIPISEAAPYDVLSVLDAEVVVSSEGEADDTLRHVGQGLYRTARNLRPVSDRRYRLQVRAPGLEAVEASSRAPSSESDLLEVQLRVPNDTTGVEQVSVRLRLKDAPGRTYYSLDLYQVAPVCATSMSSEAQIEDKSGNTTQYWWGEFESAAPFFHGYIEAVDNPFFPPEDGVFNGAFFSDQLFENSVLEFIININPLVFESIDALFMAVVSTFSEEWFAHQRSLIQHDEYLGGFAVLSPRPVEVFSNVENGLGIFAGYTSDTYRFDAEGKPWEEDIIGVGAGELRPCDSLQFSSATPAHADDGRVEERDGAGCRKRALQSGGIDVHDCSPFEITLPLGGDAQSGPRGMNANNLGLRSLS